MERCHWELIEILDSLDVSRKFKAISNKFQGWFMEANEMGFKEGIKVLHLIL